MPTKPTTKKLNASSVDIVNAVRTDATQAYQDAVPVADSSADLVKIGQVFDAMPNLANEFLNALVNRIGRVIISSKMYENPWAMFKKGFLEYGEAIENIFVNIANPNQYNPETAETNVFNREIPDVRAVFHVTNYKEFYKVTIQEADIRQAFLSGDGVSDLIKRIIDSLYTAARYDEFLTMKYMVMAEMLNGNVKAVTLSDNLSADTADAAVTSVKAISNALEFMSTEYNAQGVMTYTDKSRQYLIMSAQADALVDVNVLASAFNLDYVQFMGRRVLVDSFSSVDINRLKQLFPNDTAVQALTADSFKSLENVAAVLVDEDWFMIFDNLNQFTEIYNGEGLYWNYWYHQWKTFSVNPFANAVYFAGPAASTSSTTTA